MKVTKEILQACLIVFIAATSISLVMANSSNTINATGVNLTQTTEFRDLEYKNAELKDLLLSIENPIEGSKVILDLHIIKKEPTTGGWGNWMINTHSNDVLISRYMSTSDGDERVEVIIPTGGLKRGINNVSLTSSGWGITLLKDSTITLVPSQDSSATEGIAFRDLGFDAHELSESTIAFDTGLRNSEGELRLHMLKIEPIPSGMFIQGNWNLKIFLNDMDISESPSRSDGEVWLDIEIPSGIMDEKDNVLVLKSLDWPITILSDSKIVLRET